MSVLLMPRGTSCIFFPTRKGTDRCVPLLRQPSPASALRPARAPSDTANLFAGAAGGARFRAPQPELLRLIYARSGACGGSGRALRRRARRLRPQLPCLGRLLSLLHLNVEEIANRFIVNARHHVFKKRERLFL